MGTLMRCTVERLAWTDPVLGEVATPRGALVIRDGVGSGLATRAGDPPGTVWAIGDRGPNLKVRVAIERYGLEALAPLGGLDGAKVMPQPDPGPDLGPAIAELRVVGDRVELVRSIRLLDEDGLPISGLPGPASDAARAEPVFDLHGRPLAPDRAGLDTEGLVALPDGGFWVGDEFGPALVRVDAEGRVRQRLLPGAGLPPIAARRRLNRGFEALAGAGDGTLFLAFQSPLAHPDDTAHRRARHVRLWRLDPDGGAVTEWAYPLDRPRSFARDRAAGDFGREDVKVSELLWLGDALLVLERGSETTKLYRVHPDPALALPAAMIDPDTRPTLEERSADELDLPVLAKDLLFTSDDYPEVTRDLEGMALLAPDTLLLVSDNDFGVEGAETGFWRLRFERSLLPLSPRA